MTTTAIHPPSPAASPRLAPRSPNDLNRNLKVANYTQPTPDARAPLPRQLLDELDKTYNRRSVHIMTRPDFEDVVASVMREDDGSAAADGALGAMRAALKRRMQCESDQLKDQLEDMKMRIFLDVGVADGIDDLLPFIQQETRNGWLRYIIHTLTMLQRSYATSQIEKTQLQPMSPLASNALERRDTSSPPSAALKPRQIGQRLTRIQKTRKTKHSNPTRRSSRIREAAIKEAATSLHRG